MCCRLQQYPLPLLISYKIQQNRVLCRWSGQFARFHNWTTHASVWRASLGHRGTPPHTTLSKMSDTLATLQTQVNVLEDSIKTMMDEMKKINHQIEIEQDKINAATSWNSFLKTEIRERLSSYLAAENMTNLLISTLERARKCHDYRAVVDVYRKLGCRQDAKLRQFVKLVVACDSIKFYSGKIDTTYSYSRKVALEHLVSSKKSDIKYAKLCPECGSIAQKFWDRMKQEGLI